MSSAVDKKAQLAWRAVELGIRHTRIWAAKLGKKSEQRFHLHGAISRGEQHRAVQLSKD